MLTIRLARFGKKNHATFRVVVIDHGKAPDAAPVENLGHYDPHASEDKQFVVDIERTQYWVSQGAQATTTVASFLKKQGVEAPIRKKKTTKPKEKEEGEEAAAAPASAPENKKDAPAEDAKAEPKEAAPKEEEKKDDSQDDKAADAKEADKEDAKEEKK